jgi:putative nucleotidyltransferase with HDIG domain
VNEIARSRLIQERWFVLVRLLLIEAYLLQAHLGIDVARVLEAPSGYLLIGFAGYTVLVGLLTIFMKTWPIGLAFLTALVDTVVSVMFVAAGADDFLSPRLLGVIAAAVAVGVRRFPVLETFGFSLLIAGGIVGARYFFTRELPVDPTDTLLIGAVAILPVLARAVTLAPHEGGRDDPMNRLLTKGVPAAAALPSTPGTPREMHFHEAAKALATYTDSTFGGVLVRHGDDAMELYTYLDGRVQTDRLPTQPPDQLPGRLLAITELRTLARRDDLNTRGLPDQYPNRLDHVLAVPVPNISPGGAVLFAANRSGGYRLDDRALGALLAQQLARLRLADQVGGALEEARAASTEALLAAIDAKRPGSRQQAVECARFACAIAQELGWEPHNVEDLRLAALLHDVGELAVPDHLLDKNTSLTADEFEIMKQHPRVAARVIDFFNHSPIVLNAVFAHHERWDGRGYPQGLSGEQISLEGRIMCLADAMESMLSPKTFRPAMSSTEALQEIIKGSGTHFDPSVVQAFLSVLRREGQGFLGATDAVEPAEPVSPDWNRAV